MIDQPVQYTATEGGGFYQFPREYFEVTNPFIMTYKSDNRLFCIEGKEPGMYLIVHSLHWMDGGRFDAINGITQGTFPR